MNWTEGALARHCRGKSWNPDLARQKEYFAKARAAKKRPVSLCSFNAVPAFVPDYITQKDDPLTSTRTSVSTISSDGVNVESPGPSCLGFSTSSGAASPGRVPPDLVSKRQKLLLQTDWTGVGIQKSFDVNPDLQASQHATGEYTRLGIINQAHHRISHPSRSELTGFSTRHKSAIDDLPIRLRVGDQNLQWSRQHKTVRSIYGPGSTISQHHERDNSSIRRGIRSCSTAHESIERPRDRLLNERAGARRHHRRKEKHPPCKDKDRVPPCSTPESCATQSRTDQSRIIAPQPRRPAAALAVEAMLIDEDKFSAVFESESLIVELDGSAGDTEAQHDDGWKSFLSKNISSSFKEKKLTTRNNPSSSDTYLVQGMAENAHGTSWDNVCAPEHCHGQESVNVDTMSLCIKSPSKVPMEISIATGGSPSGMTDEDTHVVNCTQPSEGPSVSHSQSQSVNKQIVVNRDSPQDDDDIWKRFLVAEGSPNRNVRKKAQQVIRGTARSSVCRAANEPAVNKAEKPSTPPAKSNQMCSEPGVGGRDASREDARGVTDHASQQRVAEVDTSTIASATIAQFLKTEPPFQETEAAYTDGTANSPAGDSIIVHVGSVRSAASTISDGLARDRDKDFSSRSDEPVDICTYPAPGAARTENKTDPEPYKLRHPSLFVGRRATQGNITELAPIPDHVARCGRGRTRTKRPDGRPNIRRMPDFYEDPIEEDP